MPHASRWLNTHRTLKSLDYIAHLSLKRQQHAWYHGVSIGVTATDASTNPNEIKYKCDICGSQHSYHIDEYDLMAMRAEAKARQVGPSRNPIGLGDTLAGTTLDPGQDAIQPLRNPSPMHAPKSPPSPKVVVRRKHYLPTGVSAPPSDPALIGDPTPPYVPATPPEIDDSLDTPEKSLRTLKWAETEARKLMMMEQQKDRPSASAMVAYIDKVIKSQEAQVKVRGEIKRRKDEMPVEWQEVRNKIITALQPYPQALKAVIEALTRKS